MAAEPRIPMVSTSEILIVEDEAIVALDLQVRLQSLGYRAPEPVASGEEAVAAVDLRRPDLVLMDINLDGEMDGVQAAQHIQSRYQVPVVYLTASSSCAIVQRAKETGPFGYLIKPFEERELGTTIEIALYKHRAEAALRESEARFRILVEHAPEAILVFDADQERFVDANVNASRLFGQPREALLRVGLPDLSPATQPPGHESRRAAEREFGRALEGASPVVEWTYLTAASEERLCEMRLVRLPAAGHRLVRASLTDITDRKQLEKGLIALERLRALEEMVQGIAHNFNNLLVGMSGYAELIRRSAGGPQTATYIEQLQAGAHRARSVVQCLQQAMNGIHKESLQPVRLDQVVQETVEATRPRWQLESRSRGAAIEVVTQLGRVAPIRATLPGLHDILVNLLFNAVDAMPEGGTIRIATRAVDDRVELVVVDTGVGMDEEIRRRIFEPFFTTKADVGRGLGLFTVYGTVTRWGGRVEAESAPGHGTTLRLLFPRWTSPPAGLQTSGAAPDQLSAAPVKLA